MELPYGESESRSLIRRALTQRMAEEKKRMDFTADPMKGDALAANITANLSPSTVKPKMSKFATKTEAYDSVIPDDHPLKGFGIELRDRLGALLSRPEATGVNPGELGQLLAQKMLNEPGKAGAPRIWETNEYKRRADNKWFGLVGPNNAIRKPLGGQYDEWLGKVQQAEKPEALAAELRKAGRNTEADELLRDRSPIATPGGLALNVAGGAVGGLIAAGPPGALLGAAGGAFAEYAGKPIHEWMRQSEWYNAKWGPLTASKGENSTGDMVLGGIAGAALGLSKLGVLGAVGGAAIGAAALTETGKQIAADVAPYAAANISIDKVLFPALLIPKGAGKALAANPSAKNIADISDSLVAQKKLMSDETVTGKIVNRLFTSSQEIGVNPDYIQQVKEGFRPGIKRNRLLVESMGKKIDEYLADPANATFTKSVNAYTTEKNATAWLRQEFNKFDPDAIDDMLTHPNFGTQPIEALTYAATRMHARRIATDFDSGAAKAFEDKTDMAFQTFTRLRQKPADIVSEVFSKTTAKPGDFEIHPGAVKPMAGPGLAPGVRIAPTAQSAEAIDSMATARNIKPTQAFDEVKKVADTFETPEARSVLDVTTASTEMAGLTIPGTTQPARPMRTARKLSEQQQLTRLKMYQRLGMEDEAFELSQKMRAERTAAQGRSGEKTLAELEAEGIAAKQATEAAKTKVVKKGRKAGSAETPKYEDKVATDAELEKPEVIRGKAEKAAAESKAADLSTQKTAEDADLAARQQIAQLDPETASGVINQIAHDWKSGKRTAEDALHKINQITEIITDEKFEKFADEAGAGDWASRSDSLISKLRQVVGTKTFMATMGVGAGTLSFFLNPTGEMQKSEASMLDGVIKGLANAKEGAAATKAFLKNMGEAGYMQAADIAADKFLLRADEFQRGLRGSIMGGPAYIMKHMQEWKGKAGSTESFRHKWMMSPGMVFDEVLGIGKNLMSNPAVFKASYQASEYNNIMRAGKVVTNILDDAGIKSARNEVREAMKPLTEDMAKQVEFEWRKASAEKLKSEVDKLQKGLGKSKSPDVDEARIEIANAELTNHTKAMEGMGDAISNLQKKWTPIAEQLAKDHPSVRVFLALGDTPQFEKYPFLKNIKFDSNELVALGRMREQLLHYRSRVKEVGEEVISGPYAPHVMHPDFDSKAFVKMVGNPEEASAYMRFYRRSFNSRPLMPDLETSMLRYVSDTERRIQQQMFWKVEGWEKVMNMTQDMPVIYNAFKNLRDGVRPTEMTTSNKLAQRYMEFESVKRLFLSPSATLKHLIKQTGDFAQRSFGETLEAYPANTKMVGIRMAEANPTWRKGLEKVGMTAKNEQDRLMQDYFKAIVPAHGTRRMVLDLGLDLQDELFARAKSTWGKIQDIGGSGINMAEVIDRGLSVTLGRQLAEKQGLTIEQALYGTYDMILRNNFLSREFNPRWLNNPKVRAVAMFQGTPFKIFERRLVNAIRTGNVVRDLGKDVFDATKADYANGNFNQTRTILRDLRNLRQYIKDGEHTIQANAFVHTALQNTDFFGSSVMSNFAKDIMITGAATYTAGEAGMNLYHHFFHLPFLQSTTDEPTLNLNPGISAINRGISAWKKREEGDDEWLTTKIFQRWMGSGWYAALPDPVKKLHKISENDIPEIYQGSMYKYLFAIPAKVKN